MNLIELEEGDVLVLRCKHTLTPTSLERIKQVIEPYINPAKVLILDGALTFDVLRDHYPNGAFLSTPRSR